jgi:hypothetical protein
MVCNCLCGQVEFEIVGGIPNLYQCHCSLCRKQSGSTSNTATIVESKNFLWLSGQEKIASWVKDNGFRTDFCSKCGTPVPNPLGSASYYWIPAGLLGVEVQSTIVAHLYVGSKASWDNISLPGKQYETMPELAELIKLLQSIGHV